MQALELQESQALVSKYAAAAIPDGVDAHHSPVSLTRFSFGAARGRSFSLSPVGVWVGVNVAGRSLASLRAQRALLELTSRLGATASCRWADSFESLWLLTLLKETKDSLLIVPLSLGSSPKFALSVKRPTLESVQLLFQSLKMDGSEVLEREDQEVLRRLSDDDQQVNIELCLNMSSNIIQTSVLRSVVDNLRDYFREKTLRAKQHKAVEYEITTVWWEFCRFLNAGEDLKLLAQMATLPSSSIGAMNLGGVFINSVKSPAGLEGFRTFVERVLRSTSPLRSLDLTRMELDHNCIVALCSSLRYPSKLKKLSIGHTIRGAHANYRLVWAWICFAVFHVDSTSVLEHLDVSGLAVDREVIELAAMMLESPHPGRMLVEIQDGHLPEGEGCEEIALPPHQRFFVSLLDGSKVWTKPGSSVVWPQVLWGLPQKSDFEFEVLVRLSDWLCVLIPGYGYGWVARSAVRCEMKKPTRLTSSLGIRPRLGLRSLVYCGLGGPSDGATRLVQILGVSLSSLVMPSCGLNVQDLNKIIHVCPNLSTLDVSTNALTDLSPLLLAFKNHCHIKSLSILVESVNERIASQLRTLLANGLENLQLGCLVRGASRDEEEIAIWSDITKELSANSTIRRVHLSLPPTKTHAIAKELVEPLHGRVLKYETPLFLKLAFISVVECSSSCQAIFSLDRMAISNIFSFATSFATRRQAVVSR